MFLNEKKILNIMFTGVIRPNLETVKKNIVENINYISSRYNNKYKIIYNIVFYKNNYSHDLSLFLNELKKKENLYLRYNAIEPIEVSHYCKIPNLYRMIVSLNKTLELIEEYESIVVRIRIDTRIKILDISDNIKNNDLFACYVNKSNTQLSDNIFYSNYYNIKKLIDLNMYSSNSKFYSNPESYIYSIAEYYNFNVINYNYEFNLYQSNEEFYDGVAQWSKRNRTFSNKIT